MREIKLRAWSKQDGMEYISDLYWFEESLVHSFTSHDAWHPEYHFMQYTGLKDKNSKEIYESDLIQNASGRICEVIWFQPTGQWDAKPRGNTINTNASGLGTGNWATFIEIIGNIYENPELLE